MPRQTTTSAILRGIGEGADFYGSNLVPYRRQQRLDADQARSEALMNAYRQALIDNMEADNKRQDEQYAAETNRQHQRDIFEMQQYQDEQNKKPVEKAPSSKAGFLWALLNRGDISIEDALNRLENKSSSSSVSTLNKIGDDNVKAFWSGRAKERPDPLNEGLMETYQPPITPATMDSVAQMRLHPMDWQKYVPQSDDPTEVLPMDRGLRMSRSGGGSAPVVESTILLQAEQWGSQRYEDWDQLTKEQKILLFKTDGTK